MDDFYLQPNFDPTSLRVADLRRILLFHDVYFSSSAKKSELVSLFSNNITPRAKEILEENNKVSPTRPKIETIRRPKAQKSLPSSQTMVLSATTRAKLSLRAHCYRTGKLPLQVIPNPDDIEKNEANHKVENSTRGPAAFDNMSQSFSTNEEHSDAVHHRVGYMPKITELNISEDYKASLLRGESLSPIGIKDVTHLPTNHLEY